MIAYLDSSVLLRVALGEKGRLRQWRKLRRALSSELTRVECLRTLDRARLRLGLADEELAERRGLVIELMGGIDTLRLERRILDRAAEPFPTLLGTLDAIHLASALHARAAFPDLRLATHDAALGTAARACGLPVLGG
jgi:predicted nucleic acid-binding protein